MKKKSNQENALLFSQKKDDIINRLTAMLLDYLTLSELPSNVKNRIADHLRYDNNASGWVHAGKLRHCYQMEGGYPRLEIWVLPIFVEKYPLLAIWAADSDKYYIQDTKIQIRDIR